MEVKNMLDPVPLLIDVGTDHAYLPIRAVSENICKKAVAIDNKKGPLEIAKDNIRKADLSDVIFPLLSEGLLNVYIPNIEISDDSIRSSEVAEAPCNDAMCISKGKAFITPGTDYAITIAGMGGENIMSILSTSPEIAHHASKIILEPQKNIDKVKLFFTENSYEILEERNVFSDGKYYTIFAVRYKIC